MSCSHPLRESTMPVKVNLNMKLKPKLPLKRYHISVLFQCHTNTAGCALEISCRSPTRRGETYHHRHRKFLTVSLRSQHGRKRPHQAVLVRTNLQWWRRVFQPVKRERIIAIQVPGFCPSAKNSQMHHIATLLQGRCLALLTNQTNCAWCLAIQFVRLSDTPSPKAHTSR